MQTQYRQQLQVQYEQLREDFRVKAGLGPQDSVDDWIKEGLIKYPFVNHNIQGCIMARTSTATKIKVLKKLIEDFGI